jgi:DinB family protein
MKLNDTRLIKKPADGEYQANEARYADLIPGDGFLLKHLKSNSEATKKFILSLPAGKLNYKYAPGKWTIKEILAHLIDMERIYSYRILRFGRNDNTILPGFDHINYVLYSGVNERKIEQVIDEFENVRNATISLLESLPGEAFARTGIINGHPVSVCALAYHIAGHELHHINTIKEKYLE